MENIEELEFDSEKSIKDENECDKDSDGKETFAASLTLYVLIFSNFFDCFIQILIESWFFREFNYLISKFKNSSMLSLCLHIM